MKIYVKASEAPIDYMQIILDQKSNTGAGVDDSKTYDLIQAGSGLNAVAFKVFLKIRDAENFKSPSKYTRNDCEAALERLMSVENLNGHDTGVIYRGLEGNLIKKVFSRIYLGDYGNPKKLANILCDILKSQGFSYVDFDRARVGYHSEWVIEFGTEEDLGSMNDYLEQHPDMARRFSWGTLYLDKEEL